MPPQTNNDALTFDSAPVTQDTPVPALSTPQPNAQPNSSPADNSGLTFDSAPVSQDTPASALSSFTTPSGNTYTPGQQVQHSSGATGAVTVQHPETGKAQIKWYNKDASGNPITGDENGQQHTIRANDVAAKDVFGQAARWADQVSNDIKYGTDITGIGAFLKKMGAHGVYAGNPEAVGNFMASIPLGLLTAVKGQAEMAGAGAKGGTLRQGARQGVVGLTDLASGELQTGTMPSMVVGGPEAGAETIGEMGELTSRAPELADRGVNVIADTADKATTAGAELAGKVIKAPYKAADYIAAKIKPELPRVEPEKLADIADNFQTTVQPIYDEAEQALRDSVNNTAADEGVTIKPSSPSLRDVVRDTADAVADKADQGFKVMDNALDKAGFPGKFQKITKDIKTLDQKFNDAIGDDDLQELLSHKIQDRMEDFETAIKHLNDAGIPQSFVDNTIATYKKSRALEDLHKMVNRTSVTDGTRPEMADANSAPERLNLDNFEKSLNDMYNNTKYGGRRLEQALGDHATTLLQKAGKVRSDLADAVLAEKQRVADYATNANAKNALADVADKTRKRIANTIKAVGTGIAADKITGGHIGGLVGKAIELL